MAKTMPGAADKAPDPAPQQYECLLAIEHTADHKIYPVGSVIHLDHLTQAHRDRLVLLGYVRPVKK